MTAVVPTSPELAPELRGLATSRKGWTRWLSPAISLLLLGAVGYQLRNASLTDLRAALPDTLWFAPLLLALYLILPAADWVIFRRLWRLPLAGLPVLIGKRICNELLLSYSGELYFYLWARQRAGLTAAPFGAIKDVNILSALAGNVLALVLLVLAYPFVSALQMGRYAGMAVASAALMLAGPVIILVLSRRLFTLTRRQLIWVYGVHTARLLAGVLICALMWAACLPEAPLTLWIALSTIRLLVGRLPLAPNKELLFAAIAVVLVGSDHHVGALIAVTSTAMLALHLIFGALVAAWAFLVGDKLKPADAAA